jgi:hypothetical protein
LVVCVGLVVCGRSVVACASSKAANSPSNANQGPFRSSPGTQRSVAQVLGGPMCQFEEELEPYLETLKRIYKGLLRYTPGFGNVLQVSGQVLVPWASIAFWASARAPSCRRCCKCVPLSGLMVSVFPPREQCSEERGDWKGGGHFGGVQGDGCGRVGRLVSLFVHTRQFGSRRQE